MDDSERRKIRRQIESNDPELESLTIKNYSFQGRYWSEYYPPDNDWRREGEIIGRNTQIKKLCLRDISLQGFKFKEFCDGLALNKSIIQLEVYHCGSLGGEILNYLVPFMEQNGNLSCLVSDFSCTPGKHVCNGIRSLTKATAACNTLRRFYCRSMNRFDDKDLGNLIERLATHTELTEISFFDVHLRGKGLEAMAGLLENPQLSVRKLALYSLSLRMGEGIFATALGKNSTLRELSLGGDPVYDTIWGWPGIFTQLGHLSSLESLHLEDAQIGSGAAPILADSMTRGSKLNALSMTNSNIGEAWRWRDVFDALQNPLCLLQELSICHSNLNDNLVAYLANSLVGNHVLMHLVLESNDGVSPSGWESFSGVFQSSSALERVNLANNSSSDEMLVSFANSLARNRKLKELFFDGELEETDESTWGAFSSSLCNQSSVGGTYNSNHTLQRLLDPNEDWMDGDGNEVDSESLLPSRLKSLLRINRENTRAEAARRKILMVHFSGDINMQPFVGMKLKVLPQAIAWMAKDDFSRSLLYQYVRSSSVFIDISSGAKRPERELKSKRQRLC